MSERPTLNGISIFEGIEWSQISNAILDAILADAHVAAEASSMFSVFLQQLMYRISSRGSNHYR